MTLIKQYVQAMLNQDSVALSKLFSPTAIFVDYCPKDAGQAYYYAVYNGYHIRAVATIQDFSEDGEIQRLVVRPA